MANYDLSKKAAEDLYDIWDYSYETWSERQADRYYAILEQAFENIASDPMSVGKACDALVQGLRSYHRFPPKASLTIVNNAKKHLHLQH